MIKRFLSLVLCLCMMCTATVAFAGESEYDGEAIEAGTAKESINITAIAKSTAKEESEPVYSVEIVWGDMAFAWGHSAQTTTATWDTETHTYKYTVTETGADATEGWYMVNESTALTHSGATELNLTTQDAILVFNHSNRAVKAEIAIENVTNGDTDDLEAKFTKTSNSENLSVSDDVYTLTAGTEGDIFADDGSSVMGTVAITAERMSTPKAYASVTTIAKLNVTISKAE